MKYQVWIVDCEYNRLRNDWLHMHSMLIQRMGIEGGFSTLTQLAIL